MKLNEEKLSNMSPNNESTPIRNLKRYIYSFINFFKIFFLSIHFINMHLRWCVYVCRISIGNQSVKMDVYFVIIKMVNNERNAILFRN